MFAVPSLHLTLEQETKKKAAKQRLKQDLCGKGSGRLKVLQGGWCYVWTSATVFAIVQLQGLLSVCYHANHL